MATTRGDSGNQSNAPRKGQRTPEQRLEVVKRIRSGESLDKVAKSEGLSEQVIQEWQKAAERGSLKELSKKPFRAVHALTNTFSGVAGEARVAAELVRCGLRVARPMWTDDETDLIILVRHIDLLIPITVQVKSVQFLSDAKDKDIQGLKKKYLARQPGLCLAVYRPDNDAIWFVDSAKRIIELHEEQRNGRRNQAYSAIALDKDVPIRIPFDEEALSQYRVPPDERDWLSGRVIRLARELYESNEIVKQLASFWDASGVASGQVSTQQAPAKKKPSKTAAKKKKSTKSPAKTVKTS